MDDTNGAVKAVRPPLASRVFGPRPTIVADAIALKIRDPKSSRMQNVSLADVRTDQLATGAQRRW